jgi:hypothetical protein
MLAKLGVGRVSARTLLDPASMSSRPSETRLRRTNLIGGPGPLSPGGIRSHGCVSMTHY